MRGINFNGEWGIEQIPVHPSCISLAVVRCISFKLKNTLRSSGKRCYEMKSDGVISLCVPSPSKTAAKSAIWSLH